MPAAGEVDLAPGDARPAMDPQVEPAADAGKGKGVTPAPAPREEEPHSGSDAELEGATCAICLNRIPVADTAQPDGCDHVYCACCILHWAAYKEKAWCPQCKAPFSALVTYRGLDGQMRDFPAKESVCLLKCARWFQDHVKAKEQLIAEASRPGSARAFPEGSVIDETDYVDYARYYDEYDDDEEVEAFYFSSAAGRARVIGNRRHGANGFIASGRMQARPAPPPPQPPKGKKAGKAGSEAGTPTAAAGGRRARGSSPGGSSSGSPHTPAGRKQAGAGSSGGGGCAAAAGSGCSDGTPGGSQSAGRRARRNQRRAAADAKHGLV